MTKVIFGECKGALTLPKEAREKIGVTRGGQLVVDIDDNGKITLRPGVVMPPEIYSTTRSKSSSG